MLGSLISAGASLLGGFLDRDSAEDQAASNAALQREFAQHGIRWRVEDAKAAGLHPLYALQGSGATFNPNPITLPMGGAMRDAGQHLGRAVANQQTDMERELHQAQLQHLKAQTTKEFAQAMYFESEAARHRQASTEAVALPYNLTPAPVMRSLPVSSGGTLSPVRPGQVSGKPDEVISHTANDPSRTAADRHPGFKRYRLLNLPGREPVEIDVLQSEEGPAEGLEGLGALGLALWRNLNERGMLWAADAVRGGRRVSGRMKGPRLVRTPNGYLVDAETGRIVERGGR